MRAPNVTSVPFKQYRYPPVRADAAPKGCPPENVSLCAVQSSLRPARHPCNWLHRGTGRPTSRQGLPRATARRRAQRMPARHVTCSPGQTVHAPAHDPRNSLRHAASRPASVQRWPRTAQPNSAPPRMPPDKHLMCHPIIPVARLWPARLPPPFTRSPGTISVRPRAALLDATLCRYPPQGMRARSDITSKATAAPRDRGPITGHSANDVPVAWANPRHPASSAGRRRALHRAPTTATGAATHRPRANRETTACRQPARDPTAIPGAGEPAARPPLPDRAADPARSSGPFTKAPAQQPAPERLVIARNPPRPLGRDGALVTLPVPAFPP